MSTMNTQAIPARPFMPYVGGKARLLNTLLANSPENYRNYHEPFIGGGAMALAVMSRARKDMETGIDTRKRTFFLSDFDAEVAMAWWVVKHAPDEVEEALRSYMALHSEERFYKVRNWVDDGTLEYLTDAQRAARTIYLRKTAFGANIGRTKSGRIKGSYASERQFVNYDHANLHAVSELLNALDTRISHASYETVLDNAKRADFIYLDPPYATDARDGRPVIGYMQGEFDQMRMRAVVERATGIGAYTLMSNSDTPTTRFIWDGWACLRHDFIHHLGGTRATTELLVANWRLAKEIAERRELLSDDPSNEFELVA